MKKIYLMTPYSDKDPQVLVYRYNLVSQAAGYLIQKGYIVFSPITHSHKIGLEMGNCLDHDTWLRQDYEFVKWADAGILLAVDGWQNSKGVTKELGWFEEMGKPVLNMYPAQVASFIGPMVIDPAFTLAN